MPEQQALAGLQPKPDPRPKPWDLVVDAWMDEWAARHALLGRKPPGMPRKRPSRSRELDRALKEHDAEELIRVVRWAFRADDFTARHLRGEINGSTTVYLGLANLFRISKVGARLDQATAWEDRGHTRNTGGNFVGDRPKAAPDQRGLEDW